MDKQSAIKLIEETFEQPFEKKRFIHFVKNLFNKVSLEEFELHGQYIPDAFKPHISKYERIGKYEDPDGRRIDILIHYCPKYFPKTTRWFTKKGRKFSCLFSFFAR